MLVVFPQLIALHSVALEEFDGAAMGRHVQAQIVRHDFFLFRVRKNLKREIQLRFNMNHQLRFTMSDSLFHRDKYHAKRTKRQITPEPYLIATHAVTIDDADLLAILPSHAVEAAPTFAVLDLLM